MLVVRPEVPCIEATMCISLCSYHFKIQYKVVGVNFYQYVLELKKLSRTLLLRTFLRYCKYFVSTQRIT